MPTESNIETPLAELTEIVVSVFTTMMGLEVSESTTEWFPNEDRLISAVHLTGDWNGAVQFECNRRQACHFAGLFLSMDPPFAVNDVVRDVLGELANMIGGNLKCVLRQGIQLSMPSVVDGGEYSIRICGAEVRKRIAFACTEGTFWVTILTAQNLMGIPLLRADDLGC
jgi:chemotaxis protein CheX